MIRKIAEGLNNIKETSGKNDKVILLRQFWIRKFTKLIDKIKEK